MQPKLSGGELRKILRNYIDNGLFVFSEHAEDQMEERGFVEDDVVRVLKSGFHDEKFDSWSNEFWCWKYNFRGTTVGGGKMRVVFSLCNMCVIITVINEGRLYGV